MASDGDRTIIVPNPGGRRRASTPQQSPAERAPFAPPPPAAATPSYGVPEGGQPRQPAPTNESPIELSMTGMNRINAAAATLFSLISRIRNRAQHMDPERLRESVVTEIRAFEGRAINAGIDGQALKVARYAICATMDDVVLNTPWGGESSWAMQSMVGTFHRETVGGDRFFDLLARLQQDPGRNLELLEFVYMCLSLGFEGRLRHEPGGADKHLAIRQSLAETIRRQRGDVETSLSPHWRGVVARFRPRNIWLPVWVTVGVLAVILSAGFFSFSVALSSETERVTGRLASVDVGVIPSLERRAPPPPPPPPTPQQEVRLEKVKEFLKEEIELGLVTVEETGNTIKISIVGEGMFASGSDTLLDKYLVPVERVARALNDETGDVIIAGHSDNIPIRTARFPNNTALSLARAVSVMAKMAEFMQEPTRMTAEGRADKEPVARNDTADGRARNRRIEVILVKEEDA
ncbi:MAG: type VI secretion system protein TssL, long form [Pseudomonadota bacterium]